MQRRAKTVNQFYRFFMRFTAFLSHLPFFLTVYRFFQHFIHFFICICISLFALDNSWYVLRVGVYFFHHNHHKLLIHIHYHSHSHIHVVMVYDFSKRVRTLRCIFFVFRETKKTLHGFVQCLVFASLKRNVCGLRVLFHWGGQI